MTAGEYEARLKIIQYLIWAENAWKDSKATVKVGGRQASPYIPIGEIELQTGVGKSVIRNALRHCDIVASKTGKNGGYKLAIAPKSLLPRAKRAIRKNKGVTNPSQKIFKIPLTVADLMGDYVIRQATRGLSEGFVKATIEEEMLKLLKKKVLYKYEVALFKHNYL